MFGRILIANRSEIACRVIDTCRRLGIETVAVHSDADAGARHVALADQAVRIGPAPATESYLRGDAVIAAAQRTGAEAIHPGYGFLSEAPDFAEAVAAAGLVFIGPAPDAIRAMGLKDAAKARMAAAGVPVVPGYHGADQDPGHLEVEAAAIGYPLLIKAAAGGGGKGMRLVARAEDFMPALERAKSEALGAFGNDAMILERLIPGPRHIEVQVFGDGTRAVHLYERDCSLQRRHQKVLEEAPAPGMTDEMRAAMGAAAVRAAEAIGYRGAGTVEFIADASAGLRPDRFWFMEMNTRLQVEHPVTEAVTGLDLVEWQVRVAAGEPLPLAQDEIALCGHAIEARVYAEDPANGFLPAAGTITHLAFPDGARIETGVRAGDAVSPHYDPMIAKIVVQGADRALALSRLRTALAGVELAGLVTNHAFLCKLADLPAVAAGTADTGTIAAAGEALTEAPVPCSRAQALAAVGALGLDGPAAGDQGFALWQPLVWTARLSAGDGAVEARVRVLAPGRFAVDLGEISHEVARDGDGWRIDGRRVPARIVAHAAGLSVFWGNGYHFTRADAAGAGDAAPAPGEIAAPMPGLIRAVAVAVGDRVAAGQRLAVLEAMKMEHVLTAPAAGRVAEVLAGEGQQTAAGAVLIRLDEAGDDRG